MEDAQRFDKLRYQHWTNDHVRFSDLDPLGHVNNNAVGEYFENARAALFAIITPEWPWRNQIFVLARSCIDFRRELHMPANLRIGTCVAEIGKTSMKIASALFHDERGIAYCEAVSVLIDKTTRKPIKLPPELIKNISPFLGGNL